MRKPRIDFHCVIEGDSIRLELNGRGILFWELSEIKERPALAVGVIQTLVEAYESPKTLIESLKTMGIRVSE